MKVAIIFFIVIVGFSVAAYLGHRQKQKQLDKPE
jgi:hypothetical protein|tara:strand:- start:5206 stop:5307 length:102 start_codon:yes stop_codon:yes gene_type:complete